MNNNLIDWLKLIREVLDLILKKIPIQQAVGIVASKAGISELELGLKVKKYMKDHK